MLAAIGFPISINAAVPIQTSSTITTESDCGIVNLIVESQESGSYYATFRVFSGRQTDGSYCTYEVEVNGTHIGILKPEKSGWQNIAVKGTPKITLRKGKNVISVKGQGIDIPSVEYVKLGSTRADSEIDDTSYVNFYNSAETGNVLYNETAKQNEISGDFISIVDVYSVPMSYSYVKFLNCKKGDVLKLESHTRLKRHILDLFYCSGGTQEIQGLNWLNYSETKGVIIDSPFIAAKMTVTIPLDGIYCVKIRGVEGQPTGVATLYINDVEFSDCAYSYNPLEIGFPADGKRHRVEAEYMSHNQDAYPYGNIRPEVFIEGAASEPGRIVESTLRESSVVSSILPDYASGVCVPYNVKTTGMHITTLNSLAPVDNCRVIVWKYPYVDNEESLRPKSTSGIGEIVSGDKEVSVYPSTVAIDGVINIWSKEPVSGIEIFDLSGTLTYSSRACEAISASAFAKTGKGIYLVRVKGDKDSSVVKIYVK